MNVIDGCFARQVSLTNIFCMKISRTICHSVKQRLLQNNRSRTLFGLTQYDIEVSDNLLEFLAKFSPTFKNNDISRDDNEQSLMENAKIEKHWTQPRNFPALIFFLENGTIIKPLLFFYWINCLFAEKNALSSKLQWVISAFFFSQR